MEIQSSVLLIDGVLSQAQKPRITYVLGKAWPKHQPNGRPYYKMQLDCLKAANGKTLYAKAWSRKLEPDIFDVIANAEDFPITNICPF
ncbi:MAG: hypothetical protein WAO98_05360 [Alphaproteobacteria bacterium]